MATDARRPRFHGQLTYAVAVADTLGFHRAAERCHVSQPTLSAQIAQLEAVLDVQLFERDRRRVLVTPAGEKVIERARQVLLSVSDLLAAAAVDKDPFQGTLRIGVIPTVAPYLLPDVTPAVTAAYPRLRLAFREEKTEDVLEELRSGALDAGLLALVPELDELGVGEHDRRSVRGRHAGDASSGQEEGRRPSDLDEENVLLLDDGHCFRTQALALCAKVGAHEADLRATSLSTLVQMVSSGTGITLLPSMAVPVENRRAQIQVRPLGGRGPARTIALVFRPGSPVTAALRGSRGRLRARSARRRRPRRGRAGAAGRRC